MERGRKIKHVKDVFKDKEVTKKASRPRVLRHSHSTNSQGSPRMPRSPAGDPRRQLPDLPMHTPDESPTEPSPLTFGSSSTNKSQLSGPDSPRIRKGVPSVPMHSFAESPVNVRHSIVTQQSAPPALVNDHTSSSRTTETSPHHKEQSARISIYSSESDEEDKSTSTNKRSSFAELKSVFQQKHLSTSSTTLSASAALDSNTVSPSTHHNLQHTSGDLESSSITNTNDASQTTPTSTTSAVHRTRPTQTSPPTSVNLTDAFADDFSARSTRVASARSMKPGSTGTAGSTGSSTASEASTTADMDCIVVDCYPGSEEFGGYLDDDEADDERLRLQHQDEHKHHQQHNHHNHHHHNQRRSLHRDDSINYKSSDEETTSSLLGKIFGRLLKRSSSITSSTDKRRSIKGRNVYNTTYLDSKQGSVEDKEHQTIEASTMRSRRRY